MAPDRAQWQAINRQMVERIGGSPPEPLVDGAFALRVVRTTGRASGAERAVPLAVIARDGRRWLVAPQAARDWVANLDARPECTIDGEGAWTAHRRTGTDAALAAQQYARTATGPARSAFPFPNDAELDEVSAALPGMAVFELVASS